MLQIGDNQGEVSWKALGFSGVDGRYFIHIENRKFLYVDLSGRSFEGLYEIYFDKRWRF